MTDSATRVTGALGPPLDQPSGLTRADLGLLTRRTLAQFKGDDVPGLAAGVAFKIFLSLFPALLAAAGIYSLTNAPGDVQSLVDVVGRYLPSEATGIVDETLTQITSTDEGAAGGLAVVGILGGLFSATGAAVSLMRALNRAYDVGERRKVVALRVTGLALTVALFLMLVTLVGLIVLGPQLRDLLIPDALDSPVVGFLFRTGQFLLALAVLGVFFAFVYWIGPSRERPAWAWISPGATVGVLLMLLASFGFTLYTQTLGNYASSYGTLAGVVVLLLWLQLTMLAILAGGEINAEVEALRAERLALRRAAGMLNEGEDETEDPDPLLERAARVLVDGPPPPAPSTPMTRAVAQAEAQAAAGAEAADLQNAIHRPASPAPAGSPLAGEDPTDELPVLAAQGLPVTGAGHGQGVVPELRRRADELQHASTSTKVGTLAGGVMAALVFLGLARRTRRRDR